MIGIIHKVLFDLLESTGGADLVDRVCRGAGVNRDVIRINEAYPDEQFARLLAVTLEETGLARHQVIQAYADAFLVYALNLFPAFFAMAANSREFLIRQPTIHSSLSAGLQDGSARDTVNDKFVVEQLPDNSLLVSYRSGVGLCDLYHRLAHAVADHYGDRLVIAARRCGGGGNCQMQLYFDPPENLAVPLCAQGAVA